MKKLGLCLLFVGCFLFVLHAQPKPTMLTGPADWQFEQFALPPVFAPGVKYKGIEELRFSPDMFKKDAPNYFTYAFAARLDNTKTVTQSNIQDYLLTYFRGLCSKTATDRKLSPVDTAAISVVIEKKTTTDSQPIYNITLHVFGVFADGAPVTLNMEAKVWQDAPADKVYLLFIVSTQPKTAPVWDALYKIRQGFVPPSL
jgi:hypothetical protein